MLDKPEVLAGVTKRPRFLPSEFDTPREVGNQPNKNMIEYKIKIFVELNVQEGK